MSSSNNATRPIVFMDINIGETPAGRLKMELFSDIVPKYDRLIVSKRRLTILHVPLGRLKTSGSYARESTGEISPYISPRTRFIWVQGEFTSARIQGRDIPQVMPSEPGYHHFQITHATPECE